jgi:lipoprotein-anchoring transpeptidase ErfK/SrfK
MPAVSAAVSIVVSISLQMLTLYTPGQADRTWPVSTGWRGTGTESGSGKTPPGKLRIYKKIGHGQPIYEIFEDRRPSGKTWDPNTPPCDKVLTRIMWLDGIDTNGNQDTLRRYIFIHGTSNEDKVGSPYSAGCVTMKNKDVIELFDLVNENTRVTINP